MRAIQAQLEGVYRQLYTGCTQQQLTIGFQMYKTLMGTAEELFDMLSGCVSEYEELEAAAIKEAAQKNPKLN